MCFTGTGQKQDRRIVQYLLRYKSKARFVNTAVEEASMISLDEL
jgi:hypothetical protein